MRFPLYRVLLWSLIGSFVLVAMIGIVAIVVPGLVPQTGRVLGSISMFGGFSLIGLACAAGLERERAKIVMCIGLFAALAGFILGMLWIWLPVLVATDLEELLGRGTGIASIIATWAAFISALVLRPPTRPASKHLARFGIAITSLFAGYFIAAIILDLHEWWWLRGIGSGLTLLGWIIWASLIVRFQPKRLRARQFVQATAGLGSLLCLFILAVIWFDALFDDLSTLTERTLGVLIILTAAASLISVCLKLIEKYRDRNSHETIPPGADGAISVDLQCPRCRAALTLRQGWSSCTGCQLRIRIEIEEPRCACGYPLHLLSADKCPECGAAVKAYRSSVTPSTGSTGT